MFSSATVARLTHSILRVPYILSTTAPLTDIHTHAPSSTPTHPHMHTQHTHSHMHLHQHPPIHTYFTHAYTYVHAAHTHIPTHPPLPLICDRPCEKVTQIGNFFKIFFIYLAVRIFTENFVWLASCVAKIRLLLCPVDRKIVKMDKFVCVIRADNFLPYIRPYTRVM